jgi:hypothetical protein
MPKNAQKCLKMPKNAQTGTYVPQVGAAFSWPK